MALSGEHLQLEVSEVDDGARVDVFVARAVPTLSRQNSKALARDGRIRRRNVRLAASDVVHTGDVLALVLPVPASQVVPDIEVLHEDAHYLYLHKPAGMHTVRLRPEDPTTLADVACSVDPGCAAASPDPREGGALHRLDLDTTGVVVFARTHDAWTRGRAAIGEAWKLYLAGADEPALWPPDHGAHVHPCRRPPRWPPDVALPRPLEAGVEVTWPLLATGPRGSRMRVDPRGQRSTSRVWRLDPDRALFCIELVTGRRHQVRVHMAALGHPLVGDALYGAAAQRERVQLHAWAFQLSPSEPIVVADRPPWCLG